LNLKLSADKPRFQETGALLFAGLKNLQQTGALLFAGLKNLQQTGALLYRPASFTSLLIYLEHFDRHGDEMTAAARQYEAMPDRV